MSRLAPLKNVQFFTETLNRVVNGDPMLPNMSTFSGYSGYGKTQSAIYARHKFNAVYVEVGDSWAKSDFCDAILNELGTPTKGTIGKKTNKIIEELVMQDRPLIIDEFDIWVDKKHLNIVREINDKSNAPMVLIGEELLPQKLEKNERFHNRILEFAQAQPADQSDIVLLAQMYCTGVDLEDDLIHAIHKVTQGRVRRIASNLSRIKEHAKITGQTKISLSDFGADNIITGQSPKRRAA